MSGLKISHLWDGIATLEFVCSNETIAERIREICQQDEKNHNELDLLQKWHNVRISGKDVSVTMRKDLVDNWGYKHLNGWAIEQLERVFRIKLNKKDYPVSSVRIACQYKIPGMAEYVFKACCEAAVAKGADYPMEDIRLEDEYTIRFTWKDVEHPKNISSTLRGPEFQFLDSKGYFPKPVKTQDDRLERSARAVITSICATTIFFSLLSRCI